MDGTLTQPRLDFPRIKAEMGIGARPILEALAEMTPPQRSAAEAVLLRHEHLAAAGSSLSAGCKELLLWLSDRAVRTALITRNSRASVRTVLDLHGLAVDVIVSREDAPPKPDPAPLRLACRRLSVRESDAWMVGDGQYDVEAGNAAGIPTVWISHGRPRPFAAEPWQTLESLCDLHSILAEAAC